MPGGLLKKTYLSLLSVTPVETGSFSSSPNATTYRKCGLKMRLPSSSTASVGHVTLVFTIIVVSCVVIIISIVEI